MWKENLALFSVFLISVLLLRFFFFFFFLNSLVDCLNNFFFFNSLVGTYQNRHWKEHFYWLLSYFYKGKSLSFHSSLNFNQKRLWFLTTTSKIISWILSSVSVGRIYFPLFLGLLWFYLGHSKIRSYWHGVIYMDVFHIVVLTLNMYPEFYQSRIFLTS